MSVKLTTAYWKIKELNKRYRVIQGGQGASKTFSILITLFENCLTEDNLRVTIITSTYPILIDGVVADMRKIFQDAGLDFSKAYNKSTKDLHFSNGSQIQFRNLDSLDSHKGKGSRRDILFVNEANRLSYSALDSYIVRTDRYIIFDFNPDSVFWIHEKFVNAADRDDVDFIILTYLSNQMLPAGEREVIEQRIAESKKPNAPDSIKNWCLIYAEGQIGTYSERRIYDFKISEIPTTAVRISSGMDFGVVDETTLVNAYLDGVNLYLEEVFAMSGLMPEKIQGAERMSIVDQMDFIKFPKGQRIIADSSGRTEIFDLRKHGYNVQGVKKRPNRIIDSINKLRGFVIHITPNSPKLKFALENFFWDTDKDGNIIPSIKMHEFDLLAAVRYLIMSHIRF